MVTWWPSYSDQNLEKQEKKIPSGKVRFFLGHITASHPRVLGMRVMAQGWVGQSGLLPESRQSFGFPIET